MSKTTVIKELVTATNVSRQKEAGNVINHIASDPKYGSFDDIVKEAVDSVNLSSTTPKPKKSLMEKIKGLFGIKKKSTATKSKTSLSKKSLTAECESKIDKYERIIKHAPDEIRALEHQKFELEVEATKLSQDAEKVLDDIFYKDLSHQENNLKNTLKGLKEDLASYEASSKKTYNSFREDHLIIQEDNTEKYEKMAKFCETQIKKVETQLADTRQRMSVFEDKKREILEAANKAQTKVNELGIKISALDRDIRIAKRELESEKELLQALKSE